MLTFLSLNFDQQMKTWVRKNIRLHFQIDNNIGAIASRPFG